jgi:energy-converting hydrogenase Eha subunit E
MKKKFNITIAILFGIILIGKVSNWFLNFSEETNQILSAVMFILIGIAYIVDGFVSDKKLKKIILIVCGVYLIGMNFIGDFDLKPIIGIVCIFTPMLIRRILPKETNEKEFT